MMQAGEFIDLERPDGQETTMLMMWSSENPDFMVLPVENDHYKELVKTITRTQESE